MDDYEERRKPKRWAKRCEQNCMAVVTRLPLVLVYGLTTWAVWVMAGLSLHWAKTDSKGYIALFFGAVLYALANWSYSTCAFTDPGSPLNTSPGKHYNYSELPSHEPSSEISSFTVKATGGARYCKKCQCKKPDRAHHCSSCKRCVLKMDHHCPWLATCVGFRNYKAFILFIGYTTIFCYVCFGVSSSFVWTEIANEAMLRNGGAMLGINMVLLAVLSGIIGLVLTGFTGWHISLAIRNQTTIECLEKNRYATPVKKTLQKAASMPNGEDVGLMQRYGQQLAEIHANTIPGVTRIEEGEERSSDPGHPSEQLTAMEALRMNYNNMERQREEERYQDYLDEKESEKLPNAFDLGWKRNLSTLFGDNKLLWLLPICNTKGDGWQWEASPKWLAAQQALQQAREEQWREAEARQGWNQPASNASSRNASSNNSSSNTRLSAPTSRGGRRSPNKADRILGRTAGQYSDGGVFDGRPSSEMSMHTLKRHEHEDDTSSLDGLYDNEDAWIGADDEALGSGNYGHGNGHGNGNRHAKRD